MKKLAALALLSISALLIWTFVPSKDTEPTTLNISGPFEFTDQDLSKNGYLFTRLQVVEALTAIDKSGNVTPLLAKEWTTSDNNLRWEFTIRPDVIFHDGSPLTAQAVQTSLSHALKKPGVLKRVPIKEISASDNLLVIELSQPYRPLLAVLAHYTAAIAAPSSFDQQGNVAELSGTGPYKIQELQAPHKAHVIKNNEYWGTNASIEHVHYLAGHRSESRALLAQTGQADLVYTLDPASIDVLESTKNVELVMESIPRTILIKLNNEHPFLDHSDVRQAISLALDRTGISKQIVRVPGSEAYQLFAPSLGAWHIDTLEQTQRNIDQAKTLLAGQGWQPSEEGILSREGKTFNITLTTYSDRPELPIVATAIQAQLKEVGIQVNVSIDNSSAIPSKHKDGTLEMALVARNFGTTADPLALLMRDFASHKGSDWGPMNWSSEEFSNLLERLSVEPNQEQYNQMTQEASSILAEEMPLIPVTFYTQLVAVNERVNHFSFDPFEINYRISEMTIND
ncbi:ABC transporter substrate-binding protein [Vibrio gallaecicus]|uniref:ABC transporter substrate-binding protein n=1 Tax=Vibrio gallaecicus TaxID=552386 RepID=UPI0010C93B67|nr:ABC transporter substrate-binding protein [Vibrio gallaecicus]